MVGLSSLDLYKVIAPLKPTTVKEFIKKDNIKILRPLKGKDTVLNSESITSEDPKVETNKDNNKLYYISNNNAKLITRNPVSVKKFIYIN